jgi:hypothetical protein
MILLVVIIIVINIVASLVGFGLHISIVGSVLLTLLIWFILSIVNRTH